MIMKKNTLESEIRKVATHNIDSKYNLVQYQKGGKQHNEKLKALQHKSICEQIIAYKDKHRYLPMYFILYAGVSKKAYKRSTFNKGYKSFNGDKVTAIYLCGLKYNLYNGIESLKLSDTTVRLMTKFYEQVSPWYYEFRTHLVESTKYGKKAVRRGNFQMLCDNLNIPLEKKNTL